MGYVAQMALHIVPLALVLPVAMMVVGVRRQRLAHWLAFAVAAGVEPAFQLLAGSVPDDATLLAGLTATHVYLFGVVEFAVYRRSGYVFMFAMRMAYYAHWHLLWGYLRLA